MRRRTTVARLLGLFAVAACTHARAPMQSETAIRVMTFNIHSGHGDLAGTAAAIRAISPDVVGLQEVDVHWAERSGFADQASLLGQMLGMQVRFARIYSLEPLRLGEPAREFGVALLSRLPIRTWSNRTITRLSTQEANATPAPAPGLLEALIDVHGVMVRVFNTHLDYRADPRVRAMQVKEILDYVGASPTPTILVGDLNATPDAPEIQPLLHILHDAWRPSSAPGPTYPAGAPAKRIDYVLVSKHFTVTSASVPETLASDHRPVTVELVVAPSALAAGARLH